MAGRVKMKVLVAGGAGFIGSNLIDNLLEKGHEVVCVDNYFLGVKENIAHLEKNSNFTMYEHDLCELEILEKIFEKEKVEYVFQLAANSDIQASAKNPIIEYQNTYTTTFNILECMRLFGVKRLFFASTSAVYGEKIGEILTEITADLRPVSYYGGSKLGAEAIISAFSYMNDFETLVFRFPNVVGPRLTHGVIFDFIKKLEKNNTELEILGDGTQCKPYIYVTDLVEAIEKYMITNVKGMTIYNLGVEGATTVTKIADIICEKLGLTGVKYNYTGGNVGWRGDVPRFQYDLSKIYATGWRASYSSDEAVAKTVEMVLATGT
jgi:UDP-glucose 4-epimerase